MAGDDATLERLLREHAAVFRGERPDSSWLGELPRAGDAMNVRAFISRHHYFENWDRFREFTRVAADPHSSVARFEAAADAVVGGEESALSRAVAEDPSLVHARSARRHHATLLHYVGANGVENWRQRTPKNAVRIAEVLFDADAVVDATADMYGGGSTTLGLVATSIHPKLAGLQEPLMALLLSRGAQLGVNGAGNRHSLVNGCLANGRPEAAAYLAQHGAPLDLEGAAGIGRLDLVRTFFAEDGTLKPLATTAQMKDGFTWACEYGHTAVVEFLLEHGVSAGDILPRPHKQTGLHWAAYGGHVDLVKLLLKRRPPLDVRDASFNGTPLGWALQGCWERRERDDAAREPFYAIVELLVEAGAPIDQEWRRAAWISAEPRLAAALRRTT